MLPPGENIIETKTCRISGESFVVTGKDLEFYDKVSPVFNGKKYSIPSPTLCPDERHRRRLSWRNERNLYQGISSISSNPLITIYRPELEMQVVSRSEYSQIDNTQYGQNVRFDVPFFEQFYQLFSRTYKKNLHQSGTIMENSSYNEYVGQLKNCYMIFDSGKMEHTYYGSSGSYSKDCFDFLDITYCDHLYEAINVRSSSNIFYSRNCYNSSFMYGCTDCEGCHSCIGCHHLRNKEFYVFNVHVGKEEFKKIWQEIASSESVLRAMLEKSERVRLSLPSRALRIVQGENASGDYITKAQNIVDSYEIVEAQDVRYSWVVMSGARNVMDISSFGEQTSYCLEMQASGGTKGSISLSNSGFSGYIFYGGSNIWYSSDCTESPTNIFGCCDLRKASHCILNKAYSKQEYETLCGKIVDHMRSIGEWGEFFPHELSPFGYNETVAQEYFPLSEKEVLDRGWNWKHEDEKSYAGSAYQPLPIQKYNESLVGSEQAKGNISELLQATLICEVTKKPFRIIAQELAFYIENGIPIPTKHPDQRHNERMALRNPRKLWERTCDQCGDSMQTTFAPERQEIIYCEECYRKEVY